MAISRHLQSKAPPLTVSLLSYFLLYFLHLIRLDLGDEEQPNRNPSTEMAAYSLSK